MKTVLETKLDEVKSQIIKMSAMCEEALVKATEALQSMNIESAQEIIAYDEHINALEKEILSLCYALLIRHQPVAKDFRFLSASLKIVTDLERIGDYATDISEIVIEYPQESMAYQTELSAMGKDVLWMLRRSIHALMNMDDSFAQDVILYDDRVDEALKQLKTKIVDDILKTSEEKTSMLDTFMIAKYFERCGDRCVNIAESVLFFTKGQ